MKFLKIQIDKTVFYLKYGHNWLFDSGTRCMELFNSLGLMFFAFIMLDNNQFILQLPSYSKFAYITPPSYWFIMIALGIANLIAMLVPSLRANQISGFFMTISAVCWAVISLAFTLDTEFITTAPITYGLFALFCMLTGTRLLILNKAEEEKAKNKQLLT